MATTEHFYTGNGSTTTFAFTFPYLANTDVEVELDNVLKTENSSGQTNNDYTISNTNIVFNSAPGNGVAIHIYRLTNVDTAQATFAAGSSIRAADLNNNQTQALYSAQESAGQLIRQSDLKDSIVTSAKIVDGTIATGDLADSLITTAKINADAVTGAKIADDQINSEHYVSGSIDTEHIADSNITTAKIADSNVTTAKIADLNVTTAKLAAGSVTAAKIAGNSITASQLANSAVEVNELANNAVATAKIADNAVTTQKLASGAVTTTQIGADAITGDKIADDQINSEHYVAGSIDLEHMSANSVDSDQYVDGSIDRVHLAADIIDSSKLADNIIDSEHYIDGSIDTAHIANSQITTAKLATDAVTAAKITDRTITAVKIAGNSITTSELANSCVEANELANNAVVTAKIADDAVTDAKLADHASNDSNRAVSANHIKTNAVTTEKIAGTAVTDVKLASNSVTESKITDANVTTNKIANDAVTIGKLGCEQTTISDSDSHIPTSGAVVDYVAAQIAPIGGLEVIANEDSFPTSQPISGVVISIADIEGLIVNSSGVATNARTSGNGSDNVTINGFPSSLQSKTMAAGLGLMVSSTGSSQTYTYHKLLAKEADVEQLSNDINDFAARYRVHAGEPGSNNDAGDLVYDTNANKMKVYDGSTSSWKEVTSTGDFKYLFLCPAGGSGAPTINGSIATYDLRESSNSGAAAAVTSAAQLIVSVNGVIQKANTGTSAPSEGFALVDGNTIIFGSNLQTGDSVFIVQIGSAVTIPTPGDGTVSEAKIASGAVTTAKIADANVTTAKIADASVITTKIAKPLTFADNELARFGSGLDLDISHNGANSVIQNNNGNLILKDASGDNTKGVYIQSSLISFQDETTNEQIAKFISDAAVELYYDGVLKFETASNGINVVGGIYLHDNGIVTCGAGQDLKIYHDGSDSRIVDSGTGELRIDSNLLRIRNAAGDETCAVFNENGSVELRYNNVKTFETSGTGATVTGNLDVTSGIDVTGNQTVSGKVKIGTTTAGNTSADELVVEGTGIMGMTLRSDDNSTGKCNMHFSDGTTGSEHYAGLISYEHQYNRFRFGTNGGTLAVQINSDQSTNFQNNISVSGTCTATSFSGDGSNLTGISAGTALTGSTDNTICTVTGANAIQGESNLTYDGSNFYVTKNNSSVRLTSESEIPQIYFNANSVVDAGRIKLAESSGGGVMIFYTKTTSGTSTESFRIDTNQNIATNGAGVSNGAKFNVAKDGTHITCRSFATGGYDSIFFRSAQTNVGKIHFNSGGTQYHTSSDYRRKENIVNLTGAIDRVKLLQPKRFNFITDSSRTLDGFLAHEVTPAVPEAILGTKDQVANAKDVEEGRADEIGDPIYQTIDQSTLIPLLTAGLKEAIAKIETLETKVAALEAA